MKAMNNPSSQFPTKSIIIGTLLGGIGIVVLAVGFLGYLTVRSLTQSSSGSAAQFSLGSNSIFGMNSDEPIYFPDSGDIAIVQVNGVIMKSRPFLERLKELKNKSELKAVVVRIDSPGGAVGPSQEMLEGLKDVSQKLKVVCSFGDIAASGGYYIAAGCEKIVANPGTLTGSIGVIMNLVNLKGLYEWAKVQPQVLKAGRYKDMGSESKALSEEEKKLFQNLLDDVHAQFKTAVQEARKLPSEKIDEYCDGRIFTGSEAKRLGFVDELGGEKVAVQVAAELAGIKDEPKVIRERRPRPMAFPFFGRNDFPWEDGGQDEGGDAKALVKAIRENLPLGSHFQLKPATPYFLPSFFLSQGVWQQ
jgi:protease-4